MIATINAGRISGALWVSGAVTLVVMLALPGEEGVNFNESYFVESYDLFSEIVAPFVQRVIAVDTDVDIFNPVDVDWAVTTRFNADTDLMVLPGEEGHILNPMVSMNPDGKGGTITKVGMDAMVPFEQKGEKFERMQFQEVDLKRYDIKYD